MNNILEVSCGNATTTYPYLGRHTVKGKTISMYVLFWKERTGIVVYSDNQSMYVTGSHSTLWNEAEFERTADTITLSNN